MPRRQPLPFAGFLLTGLLLAGLLLARFLLTGFLLTGLLLTRFLLARFLLTSFLLKRFPLTSLVLTGFLLAGFLLTGFLLTGFLLTGFLLESCGAIGGLLLTGRGRLLLGGLALFVSLLLRVLAFLASLLLGVLAFLANLLLGLCAIFDGLLLRLCAIFARLPLGIELRLGGFLALLTTRSLGLRLELASAGTHRRDRRHRDVLDRLRGLVVGEQSAVVDDVFVGLEDVRLLECDRLDRFGLVVVEIGDDRAGSQDLTCVGRPFF